MDNIKTLTDEIENWIFLRSLTPETDSEKVSSINSKIEQLQKNIYSIRETAIERDKGTEEVINELFAQAFKPLRKDYFSSEIYREGMASIYRAPNGGDSKLSPDLQKIINTDDFILWFGNFYETQNPTNVSKVVDVNGEPLVVWHGTGSPFGFFRFDRFPAAYFAVNKPYSDWFAKLHGNEGEGYVIPFFLNIKKPLDLTKFGLNKVKRETFWNEIFLKTGLSEQELGVRPQFLDPAMPALETWVYLRNNPEMLKNIKKSQLFDGITFDEIYNLGAQTFIDFGWNNPES